MSLPSKRDDLQCWRALSILAVLLFHIWPEHFPNGYLGVDIFFVLSGYLMACLYSFDSNIFLSIVDFYYRRIKRILPIYLITILATLLFLSQQVFPEEYALIIEDSKWAIKLATNLEDLLKNRGYFETEASFRFFRHCWSLAVEMQFYLLFPFIAISQNYMSTRKYQILLLSILVGSGFYQIFSTNPIVQYESVFCRIWQFSAGMLAQTLPILSIKYLPSILLLATSILIFCATSFPRLVISFVTIFAASGIISMSTAHSHPFKSIFRLPKILQYAVYLGDISYVLYLIHWPLITYAKFMSSTKIFGYFDGFLLFMTSILLSMIIHIVIEKPILKFCNGYRNLAICIIILYSCSIYLPSNMPQKASFSAIKRLTPSNLTLTFWKEVSRTFDSSLKLPPKWSKQNDLEFVVKLRGEYLVFENYPFRCRITNTTQFKPKNLFYCEVDGLNPNGTLVALSIGNSFSMNIISAISSHPSIKKVINVYANSAQFPVHDEFEAYLIEKLIKRIKPDVTLLIQQYYDGYLYKTPVDKINEHKEFKHWNNVLEEISKYTSAIIINKEQLSFPYDIGKEYIRKTFYGLPVETKLKHPPASPNLEAWLNALNCSKCGFYSYRKAFCDGEFCQIMDLATSLPLFRDTGHISPIGVRHIKPLIDKEINRILNITVSN